MQTMKEEEKMNLEEEDALKEEQTTDETSADGADVEVKIADGEANDEETEAEDAEQSKYDELHDKYLRSVAEFDNYRKRTIKEKAELILNGGSNAIKAILPVLDDMERAIENGTKTDDPQVLREGMELIYQKFQKALNGLGVTVIDTKDADFDVDIHEAVAMVPGMGDEKKGKVIDCLQRGYKLNDKVIRHAKVAVGQ